MIDESMIGIPHKEPEDNPISTVMIDPLSDDHAEEFVDLRAKNENLRDAKQLVHETAKDIETKSDLIDKLRRTLKQVYHG